MDFPYKVEVFKQYSQPVMNRENFDYFKSVIQKLLEIKVRTMAMVFEKNLEICYGRLHKSILSKLSLR